MGHRPATAPRKRRTREHIIATLSDNAVERVFLERGHKVGKTEEDYGIDLVVMTFDQDGFVEPGEILVQLKASDSLDLSADGTFYSYSISIKDYSAWIAEPMPMFLILYDVQEGRGYWQYVQAYLESQPLRRPNESAQSVTIRFPVGNRFDGEAVDYARARKQDVLTQTSGVLKHAP